MTSRMRLLDIENRLAEDSSGNYRDEVCDQLRTDAREVKRRIDSGLTPDEFQDAGRYLAALEAAISVVEQAWRFEHNRF